MHDDDLEWLLCVCPGLLGQRSNHAGITAVLEGGGSGAYDSSAAESLIERARPHVDRARRLGAVWASLDGPTRKLLEAHYLPVGNPAPGVRAMLGVYAGPTLYLSEDRPGLELACSHGALVTNRTIIDSELKVTEEAVAKAHRAWRDAKTESLLAWVHAE